LSERSLKRKGGQGVVAIDEEESVIVGRCEKTGQLLPGTGGKKKRAESVAAMKKKRASLRDSATRVGQGSNLKARARGPGGLAKEEVGNRKEKRRGRS